MSRIGSVYRKSFIIFWDIRFNFRLVKLLSDDVGSLKLIVRPIASRLMAVAHDEGKDDVPLPSIVILCVSSRLYYSKVLF